VLVGETAPYYRHYYYDHYLYNNKYYHSFTTIMAALQLLKSLRISASKEIKDEDLELKNVLQDDYQLGEWY